MKRKAVLIAAAAAATMGFVSFAQGGTMERDGGHTGSFRDPKVQEAPHFPGPLAGVVGYHHYRHGWWSRRRHFAYRYGRRYYY